jgi:hypothetical protein
VQEIHMSKPDTTDAAEEPAPHRKPYVPPQVESEQVIEKQLMVICYTIDEGCQQDPPQS